MIGKRWIIGCWIAAMGGCLMACAPQAVREAEDVVAHEIGHSLGMEHSIYGIMTEAQDSPGRRPEATAQNIGQCISNVFRAYIYNTDAKGTINGSLNKHGRVIKIQ